MENLYEFNSILYGFTYEGDDKRIMAFQDGDSKESLSDSSFNANEQVRKFVEYKDNLYALVGTTSDGRLLRLDVVNSGENDTWTEVVGTSTLNEAIYDCVYSEDSIIIFGQYHVFEWDNSTCSLIDTVESGLTIYYAMTYRNAVYIYGEYSSYGTDYQAFFKYENGVFTSLHTSDDNLSLDSRYDVYGKELLCEYRGKIYYIMQENANLALREYVVSDNTHRTVMDLFESTSYFHTAMLTYDGLILIAYSSITGITNVMTYVPVKFELENVLVPGDGDVNDLMKRVNSDPINTETQKTKYPISSYDSYPLIGCLKGKLNSVFKYCHRNEFYSEINDVSVLFNIKLKSLLDQICTLSNYVLFVNGKNTAIVDDRSVSGYSDKFMDVKQNTDYGNNQLVEIENVDGHYPNDFRKIVINWSNINWEENNPVAVGSSVSMGNIFEYDSVLVNDPITAKNIATNLLNQLINVEQLRSVLSFSYYLEQNDNLSFKVLSDFIYMDENREYKIYAIEHNIKDMTTNLILLERVIVDRVDTL